MNRYTMTLTQKDLFKLVRELGLSIKKTEYGEYRINYKDRGEASAYYTDDRDDALATARAMIYKTPPSHATGYGER